MTPVFSTLPKRRHVKVHTQGRYLISGIRPSDVAGEVWVWRSVLQSGIAILLFNLEMVVISGYQLLNKHALMFGSSNVVAQAGYCTLKQVLHF